MTRLRENLGYSQNQLATELNQAGLEDFYQTTVSRIEKGERAVRLNEALIIARVLGSSIDYMLTPDAVAHSINDIYSELHELKRCRKAFEDSIINFEGFRLQTIMAMEDFSKLPESERLSGQAEQLTVNLWHQNEDSYLSKLLTESAYEVLTQHLSEWTQNDSEEATRETLNSISERAKKLLIELELIWSKDNATGD